MQQKRTQLIPLLHGIYLMITALWALLFLNSFVKITGIKTDIWLVKTIAILLLPYSLLFMWKSTHTPKLPVVNVVAVMLCMGLTTINAYYYAEGVLGTFYMIDAWIEIFLSVWWLCDIYRKPKRRIIKFPVAKQVAHKKKAHATITRQ